MQDHFLGDVGDYIKFGMLRLFSHPVCGRELKIGIVWYYIRSNGVRSPSRFRYLLQERFGRYDVDLFLKIKRMIASGATVRTVPSYNLLPKGTIYVDDEVSTGSERASWFRKVCLLLGQAELIYLDPDNGIRLGLNRVSRFHVEPAEIQSTVGSGTSLIVYHHLNRNTKHSFQMGELRNKLRDLDQSRRVYTLWSSIGGGRAFAVLADEAHDAIIRTHLRSIERSAWHGCVRISD